MSSETDRPRQRTVAELLAANGGDAVATGRRRRRRETDPEDVPAVAPAATTAMPPAGSHSGTRRGGHDSAARPAPWSGAPAVPDPAPQQPDRAVLRAPVSPNGRFSGLPDGPSPAVRPAAPPAPAPERPTQEMPRLAGSLPLERAEPTERPVPVEQFRVAARPAPDPGLTAPIEHQRSLVDEGPATMVGAAPVGAEAWHRTRTNGARPAARPDLDDGGPPTEASPLDLGDDLDFDAPPPRRSRPPAAPASFDRPAGFGPPDAHDDEALDDEPRLDQAAATGQAWVAVLVQWIVGALAGAALWVGFRFLWRSLPVVALAASALVTIGLVVLVRAMLRNDDKRTTVFAVLVGLLLTVSPAILVLLDR